MSKKYRLLNEVKTIPEWVRIFPCLWAMDFADPKFGFEEIKEEPSKEVFTWTDELVKSFAFNYSKQKQDEPGWAVNYMNEFKASKTNSTKEEVGNPYKSVEEKYYDLIKSESEKRKSQPTTNKDRIEIEGLQDNGAGLSNYSGDKFTTYSFNSKNKIPPEKFPLIKQAIESVLNDDGMVGYHTGRRYYSEKELLDREQKAFEESRLTHPMIGFKHKDFSDYKNSKP